MRIYKSEILDGLQQKILDLTSSAIDCNIIKTFESCEATEDIKKVIAQTVPICAQQPDLYYINSVLVSNGWNKNDDVFDKHELWIAKETPKNKPFNYMHINADILGHITDSLVLDINGNKVIDEPQNDFDIIINSVIYKILGDEQKEKRIRNLIKEIENGQWFVSMECLFDDFDYAVITPNGEHKVIQRNKDSAFLTKHLRIYGGKGEYEGYKLGRLLRNIIFTAVGLVDKPANPRSIIFHKDTNPFLIGSMAMHVENTEEIKTNADELVKKLEEKDLLIEELKKRVEELKNDFNMKEDELNKLKNEVKSMKRKSMLMGAGVDEKKIEEIMNKFDKVDDEIFDHIVSLYKEKTSCVIEDKIQAEVENEVETEVEEEEDLDVTEEVEASLNDPGEVKTLNDKAVASAIEWLSNNVLKTVKGVK